MLGPKAHGYCPTNWDNYTQVSKGVPPWQPIMPISVTHFWHLSTKKPPELVLTLLVPFETSWYLHPCFGPSTRWIELIHIWNHFILSLVLSFSDLNRDSSSCQKHPHPLWGFNHTSLKTHTIFVEIDNGHGFLIRKNVCRQQQRYSSFQVTQGPSSLIPSPPTPYFRKPERLEKRWPSLWCFNSFN